MSEFLNEDRLRIAKAAIEENLTLDATKMFLYSIVASHENYRAAYDQLLQQANKLAEKYHAEKKWGYKNVALKNTRILARVQKRARNRMNLFEKIFLFFKCKYNDKQGLKFRKNYLIKKILEDINGTSMENQREKNKT